MSSVLGFNSTTGVLRVQGGASLDSVMRMLVPRGWFVPVTPGTRFVTLGGAIASDIHGKNHHVDGSFCSHVESLVLATPIGRVEVSPTNDPELFWATAGGMGLTGVVLEATLRMIPVETSWMLVDTERAADLDDCLDRMQKRDGEYRYSVAWVDCLARGRNLGRAVITRANHARIPDLSAAGHSAPERASSDRAASDRAATRIASRHLGRAGFDPLAFDPRVALNVPFVAPPGLLNTLSLSAFNEAWYRKAPRQVSTRPEPMASFFHPLDGVGAWNRLYGPRGFLQYQLVVPFGAEDTIRAVIEQLAGRRVASFLAVLKSFGPGNPGPLSFPIAGWTLALDLPAGQAGLSEVLDDLDEQVAEAGGRVYLAKDSRLRPELLASMYPRLDEWRAVRRRVDPDGLIASDLGRRLSLCEDPTGARTGDSATHGSQKREGHLGRLEPAR
jgi:decaprenylphospho-beta-D-ribofuranose 2-oxidase